MRVCMNILQTSFIFSSSLSSYICDESLVSSYIYIYSLNINIKNHISYKYNFKNKFKFRGDLATMISNCPSFMVVCPLFTYCIHFLDRRSMY